MSFIKRLAGVTVAAALVAAPTLASAAPANPASSLSVAKSVRASGPAVKGDKIAAGSTATIVSIGILAALVGIVLVATGGDDDSDSN